MSGNSTFADNGAAAATTTISYTAVATLCERQAATNQQRQDAQRQDLQVSRHRSALLSTWEVFVSNTKLKENQRIPMKNKQKIETAKQ
jgi:hypothetical protein